MKTKVINLGYEIVNIIGEFLIILGQFIGILRSFLFGILFFGIVMGIFLATTISFFALTTEIFNINPTHTEMYNYQPEITLNMFSVWYWNLLIFVLGGATIVFGMKHMFD